MASIEKYTDDAVMMLLKHSQRELKNDSNKDIVEEKKDLNYSIPIEKNGLTPKQYYMQLKDNSYLYGRGTKREDEAVTCCGWIITLPKSVSDYSMAENDEIKILNPKEEKVFFEGVTQFVNNRYGTVFYNRVHYDEAGQPHIHIYFVPITKLDHEQVHYKTIKTHTPVKTESGRYEFSYRFKLENGKKIPLKNYAKMSDYYDTKISAADVINKYELRHFHSDLMKYLKDNNLPGANSVYTGKTDGKNISVKALKEFTKSTGITIEELREYPLSKADLSMLLDQTDLSNSVRQKIEAINNEAMIEKLQNILVEYETAITHTEEVSIKNQEISLVSESNMELVKKVSELEELLSSKQQELERANTRIEELEKEKSVNRNQENREQGWGHNHSSSWVDKSMDGWGTKNISTDVEKNW